MDIRLKGKVTIMADSYMNELNYAKSLYENGDYSECLQYIIQKLDNEIEVKTNEEQEIAHKFILDFSAISIDAIVELFKIGLYQSDWEEYYETLTNTFIHACTIVGDLCNVQESYDFTKMSLFRIGQIFQDRISESFSELIVDTKFNTNAMPGSFHFYFVLIKARVFEEMLKTTSWKSLSEEKQAEFDEMKFIDNKLISNQGIECAFALYESFAKSDVLEDKWYAVSNIVLFGKQEIENLSKNDDRYVTLANIIVDAYKIMLKDCKPILHTDFNEKQAEFDEFVKYIKTENKDFIFNFEKRTIASKKELVEKLKKEIPESEEILKTRSEADKGKHKKQCVKNTIILAILAFIIMFVLRGLNLINIEISIVVLLFFIFIWEILRNRSVKKYPYASSDLYINQQKQIERSKRMLKEAEDYLKSVKVEVEDEQ